MIYNAPAMRVLRGLCLTFLVACSTASTGVTEAVPEPWKRVAEATAIRTLQLADDGTVRTVGTVSPRASEIRVEGGRLMRGGKALTEAFPAIESFDVSTDRGEVVFSAQRGRTGFDVGLVSLDGSPISWVPNDPADEVNVSWAPRGNKIAYVIRTRSGDFVRTVHIPTSAQLTNEFPYARVHALAWNAAGDKYAVSVSSPEASDRVEVMRYGGEERRTVIAPQTKLDVSLEAFGPDAVLIRPSSLRYGEKLPVVIWQADDRLGWDDARAGLQQQRRLASVVTTKAPDEALWTRLRALEWIDASRRYTVLSGAPPPSAASFPGRTTEGTAEGGATLSFVGDPGLSPDRYSIRGRVIAAAPSVVKSVAAGFIADQLKGNPPPNGSSR
jgi:hypothetical protein